MVFRFLKLSEANSITNSARDASVETLGLYVHVPFCAVKCFYCDFTAFAGQKSQFDRYIDAVDAEAGLRGDGLSPETLYFGGGTPSELPVEALNYLLTRLDKRFGPLHKMREVTFEANPESLSVEKMDVLSRAGVSRLSLGLQTAEDALLKAIGRRHSFEEFLTVYREAQRRGFAMSVDLMFGLPGQTRAQARASVQRVLELDPGHISVYGLQVMEKTVFGKREVEVNEDLARLMMEDTLDALAGNGYKHYEVSNFARPGREGIHNLNYWVNGSYLGLGCGAAGYLAGERYQNEEKLKVYCERVEAGRVPTASSERLTGKEALGETMMLKLRLMDGMPLTTDLQDAFRGEIEGLVDRGLLTLETEGCSRSVAKLSLTAEGVFLANEVYREFVPPFSAAPKRHVHENLCA